MNSRTSPRNKAVFSNFSRVLWTGKLIESVLFIELKYSLRFNINTIVGLKRKTKQFVPMF